jgi:hypothetical protein
VENRAGGVRFEALAFMFLSPILAPLFFLLSQREYRMERASGGLQPPVKSRLVSRWNSPSECRVLATCMGRPCRMQGDEEPDLSRCWHAPCSTSSRHGQRSAEA